MFGQRSQSLLSELKLSTQRPRASWSSHKWWGFCQYLQQQCPPCSSWPTYYWPSEDWLEQRQWLAATWRTVPRSGDSPNFILSDLYMQSHMKDVRQRGDVSKAAGDRDVQPLAAEARFWGISRTLRFHLFFQVRWNLWLEQIGKWSLFFFFFAENSPHDIICGWILS